MLGYFLQNPIGAIRIPDEEPKFAKLVVDGKCSSFVREIDPDLHDMICQKSGNRGTRKCCDMIAEGFPRICFREA